MLPYRIFIRKSNLLACGFPPFFFLQLFPRAFPHILRISRASPVSLPSSNIARLPFGFLRSKVHSTLYYSHGECSVSRCFRRGSPPSRVYIYLLCAALESLALLFLLAFSILFHRARPRRVSNIVIRLAITCTLTAVSAIIQRSKSKRTEENPKETRRKRKTLDSRVPLFRAFEANEYRAKSLAIYFFLLTFANLCHS